MITADELDRLCVLTYTIVQGDTHTFTQEDWDFLDEVAVHAEDVLSSTYNEEDLEPDLDTWEAEGGFAINGGVEDEYDLDD